MLIFVINDIVVKTTKENIVKTRVILFFVAFFYALVCLYPQLRESLTSNSVHAFAVLSSAGKITLVILAGYFLWMTKIFK